MIARNEAPPEQFSTRKAGSVPGTLCYCWHVVKTGSGDGVNGEEADHSIDDLTGELRWKAFGDSGDSLCSGPSHDSVL